MTRPPMSCSRRFLTSTGLPTAARVPVHVVAERLGHSDPAITLRIYAHVMRTHAAGVAGIFAAAAAQSEPANAPETEDEETDEEDGPEEAAGVPR